MGQIDWVTKQAECTLDRSFSAVHACVKHDVDTVNKTESNKKAGEWFGCEGDGDSSMFTIRRKASRDCEEREVRFSKDKDKQAIQVDRTPLDPLTVAVRWNDEKLACVLSIDDVPYEPWQVSQKALGPLFFPIDYR